MRDLKSAIAVEITVKVPVEKAWKLWTTPADIMQWNVPFDNWHSPKVQIDLKEGGSFLFRMEPKDRSSGFNHSGRYDKVITCSLIEYTLMDCRKSIIKFIPNGNQTTITETFEPEIETSLEIQRDFCKRILTRFKEYAERDAASCKI